MNINSEKIIGWLVFFAGLTVIFYSIYSSVNIFTGKAMAPEIFEEEIKEPLSDQKQTGTIQEQMQQMMMEQLKEFIPINVVPRMLNLAVWTMLASFLVFAGAQVSGLGIKLIKK